MMTSAAKSKAATADVVVRVTTVLLLCAALGACSTMSSKDKHPEAAAPRVLPPPTPRTEGAIYQAGQEMALFADLKARRVGDVVTMKSSATADTATTIFGKSITTKGVPILDTTLSGSNSFDGEGSSSQGNSLVGSLTVTVTDVQANGNLVVQGDKSLKLNQGEEFIHIAGVIRPADIATNNTVTSDKLADAHISYSGKGVIDSANRMGWLTRFFNSAFAPL